MRTRVGRVRVPMCVCERLHVRVGAYVWALAGAGTSVRA